MEEGRRKEQQNSRPAEAIKPGRGPTPVPESRCPAPP